ncbi:MAG: branched-chain amino acid ABC transporter permease, partial [Candidatus Bathyarchaeia archaeon]
MVVILVILFLLPFLLTIPYFLAFLTSIFISITLAESFNIFSGYSGLVCLGYAAFYGIGAYTSALLINSGLSPFISFLAGGIVAVILAAFIGGITLRLRSIYFVMATYSFAEILREIFRNWKAVGGVLGITLPPTYTHTTVYATALTIMLTCVFVTYKL